mmetsp:Transcript_24603/g.58363  ORF Transcript_24603/g.58363 Transcript_24603/m.58363 type:complete len:795 (+) Transcript_24603:98-2482(+)|eukprot:CAMPEP_0181440922 /NCGR_PEP_ID=MMETSP1110-20121109/23231_1 /TAXON_ID=174948 /ORGANISM="Symbiodinium sp., Strain CCMP421" /LENGTH=794 /DNA_ID=CAMNT_0023564769 /DNA_START=80 /DNA_END=2464 /DNA_ORIENTATION=-
MARSCLLAVACLIGTQPSLSELADDNLPTEADDTCQGGTEECDLSLRQLRADKIAALTQEEEQTVQRSLAEKSEEEGSRTNSSWYWGLAHGGSWTGGMCMWYNCDASRGKTVCHHFRCICAEGVAAAGKCFDEKFAPKTHMGLRRTGESCGVRGYCLDKAGPATCIDSYCFCLEGSVFQNGRCSDPGIDGGISGPSGPSGGAVPGEKDKEEGTPEVTEAVEETTTTPYVEPEDPTKDPDCSDQIAGTECFKKIKWAMSDGIYANPGWYPGLTPQSAPSKFQDTLCRAGEGGCPRPCTGGLPEDPLHFPHSVMTRSMRGIRPPKHPFEYNGIEWPAMKIKGTNTHIFAVGDWGGLAGTLPHNSQIIQYKGGQTMGPHVMGRYRTDAKTHDLSCSTPEMSDCFATNGTDCPARCGWIEDIDTKAQHLVADQMIKRAKMNNPDYLLNVGDNFYWGGIAGKCGETPMSKVNDITRAQFNWIFENVYKGPGLDGKPWLSVLGNHDWGGREMDAAWDQQIAYTWVSNRWVLPAPYWMQKVEYVDQGFTVDIFMIDSNIEDADEDVNSNPEHNICGAAHNPPGSSCAKVGGPSSIHECHNWFQKLWDEGAQWATEKLKQSDAQWQIMVTHFPCGHKVKYYKELHLKYGLDLLVTGHTHYQMMYWAPEKLGGLACFITGGGGGITSENNVELENDNDHQYGFFDLSMSKDEIKIESINWKGNVIHSETVEPYDGTDTKKAELAPCEVPKPGSQCFKVIKWAMQDGIHSNPDWFPGLTSSSPMSKFQEKFYREHKDGCGKPCD